jgi:hypothetical protein
MNIQNIEDISYRNNTVDRGIILGRRNYRWELKKKYRPLWARIGSRFVSALSPQKKNFQVYIPASELKGMQGKKLVVGDGAERKEYKILAVEKFSVSLEAIETQREEKSEPAISTDNIPF